MESIEKIELIPDNLTNQELEPEDGIIAASTLFQQIVKESKQNESPGDWRKELDEI